VQGAAAATKAAAGTPRSRPASRAPRDPLIGTEVAGRFLIEDLIGQGGMGKVYKARHLALDKTICLKTLKPALLEDPTLVGRFEREAKAASRLNHPNVIGVIDFGRIGDEGTLYIAMEFVHGRDLRLILRDEWPIGEERLIQIMAQVLAALGEAHNHNVIHRDLKPENIMVEQRRDAPDFVKVLDFGIAKIMDSDAPGLTRSDVVCGTPQYMAPEQATGSALDARCDLYAVGVILYQLTTGHLPFDGQNSMEVLTKHVNEPPVPPRQKQPDAPISAAMEKLILHALEKEPSARPQTAEEFRKLLLGISRKQAAAITDAAQTPKKGGPPPAAAGKAAPGVKQAQTQPPAPSSRMALYLGGLVALLVALGAAAALLFGGKPRPAIAVPESPGPSSGQTRSQQPGTSPSGSTLAGAEAKLPVNTLPGAEAKPQHDPAKAAALVAESSRVQNDGDTGAARDLLEQAEQLDPDNAEVHFRLARLYHMTRPQRAREEYQAAIRLNEAKYGEPARQALGLLQ
jgi:tRNA A-37 threonylcarbamoyl transferase component Bud32